VYESLCHVDTTNVDSEIYKTQWTQHSFYSHKSDLEDDGDAESVDELFTFTFIPLMKASLNYVYLWCLRMVDIFSPTFDTSITK
jgi:hypothetical protein